jgi:hypothetical protein
VAWASSSGDDLSALDATMNGALVEGSRLQPPINKTLGRRMGAMAVALDEDSEGSASNEEEEAEVEEEEEDRRRRRRASLWLPPAWPPGSRAMEIELDGSSRRRVPRRGRARQWPGRARQWLGHRSTVDPPAPAMLALQPTAMPALQPTARGETWCRMHTARPAVPARFQRRCHRTYHSWARSLRPPRKLIMSHSCPSHLQRP